MDIINTNNLLNYRNNLFGGSICNSDKSGSIININPIVHDYIVNSNAAPSHDDILKFMQFKSKNSANYTDYYLLTIFTINELKSNYQLIKKLIDFEDDLIKEITDKYFTTATLSKQNLILITDYNSISDYIFLQELYNNFEEKFDKIYVIYNLNNEQESINIEDVDKYIFINNNEPQDSVVQDISTDNVYLIVNTKINNINSIIIEKLLNISYSHIIINNYEFMEELEGLTY